MGDSRTPPSVEGTPDNHPSIEQENMSDVDTMQKDIIQNDKGPETPVGAANLQVRRSDTLPSIQTSSSPDINALNSSMRIGNYGDMSKIVREISMRVQRLFSSAENIEKGFSVLETRVGNLMEAKNVLEEENSALNSQISDLKVDNKMLLMESKTHGRTLELMQSKMDSLAKDLRSADAAQKVAEQSNSMLNVKYLELKTKSERDLKLATSWFQMKEVEHEHAAAEAHGFIAEIQSEIAHLKSEKKSIEELLDEKGRDLESCKVEMV